MVVGYSYIENVKQHKRGFKTQIFSMSINIKLWHLVHLFTTMTVICWHGQVTLSGILTELRNLMDLDYSSMEK